MLKRNSRRILIMTMWALVLSLFLPVLASAQGRWGHRQSRSRVVIYSGYQRVYRPRYVYPRPYVVYQPRPYYVYQRQPYYTYDNSYRRNYRYEDYRYRQRRHRSGVSFRIRF